MIVANLVAVVQLIAQKNLATILQDVREIHQAPPPILHHDAQSRDLGQDLVCQCCGCFGFGQLRLQAPLLRA